MTPPGSPRPIPERNLDNEAYWEGLAQGELRLQRCIDCDRPRFPPMTSCPYCGQIGSAMDVSPGHGSLYSFVVVHHAFSSAFTDDVPYTVGTVELDEGCRMLGRLELGRRSAAIGMRLEIAFRRHADPSSGSEGPW